MTYPENHNQNNIKGWEGEKEFTEWKKTTLCLKGLTNIKQSKTGSKGVDFEAFLGSQKIAIQVKKKIQLLMLLLCILFSKF